MSAAPSLAFEATPQRAFPRHPINVPLDLIALRSGVPENLPGRCTDISEAGVGAVVAGELSAGQQVAVELRLPNVGVPVRARAMVRYQSKLHCGIEFVGLSLEQREMIRYWIYRSTSDPADFLQKLREADKGKPDIAGAPVLAAVAGQKSRRIRIRRSRLIMLIVGLLLLVALAWWQWQRSWNELEIHAQAAESGLRVSPETMQKRIVTKVEPLYPEAAREAATEGLVVLDAVIGQDGSVKEVRPVSGSDLLIESATAAVRSWKFEPYLSSGKPVEVETTIAVEFRMN